MSWKFATLVVFRARSMCNLNARPDKIFRLAVGAENAI